MSFDLRLKGGDLAVNSDGEVSTVENTPKLVQDILKIITTEIGANRRFPYYGCPISQSLVGRGFDQQFVASVATNQLRYSLEILQRLQQEQLRKNQLVTPQEQIAAIENVRISRNPLDPRFFEIVVNVINKAFRRAEVPVLRIQL